MRRAVVVALGALVVAVPAAEAKTFKANKLGDHAPDGCTKQDCTLREAVTAANDTAAKDRVALRPGETYTLAIAGRDEDANATGDIDLLNPVRVVSHGKKRAKVLADGIDRVFHDPAPGTDATIRNLVVQDGDANGGISTNGGGIELDAGTLKLKESYVRHNAATSGGGVRAQIGTLKVVDSTVKKNSASDRGGGIFTDAETKIKGSTLAGNEAGSTGGGIKSSSASLEMKNDTISGNLAGNDGGGISNLGSGTLNDVTIVRNTATLAVAGGIDSPGTTMISNSIIALNVVDMGGPLVDSNCDGSFMSGGHNLRSTSDVGCNGFTGTGDIVDANPKLGDLADNGGPTKTVALKPGSPAIGAAGGDSQAVDQRGVKRDAHPDIGAYER